MSGLVSLEVGAVRRRVWDACEEDMLDFGCCWEDFGLLKR